MNALSATSIGEVAAGQQVNNSHSLVIFGHRLLV